MKNKKSMILMTTLLAGLIVVPAATFAIQSQKASDTSAATTVITTRSSQTYIDSYYSSISSSLSGTQLKSSLETLLEDERVSSFSYGSLHTAAFPYTDVDPLRPTGGYIVSFYSGTPVSGYTGMNKEHTWPDSHGGSYVENDPHVIRPTLTSENSSRGNQYYAESSSNGWDPDTFGNEKYRGIAARIIFYAATIGNSSGLILEDVGRGQGSGTGNRMGKLGDLLQWNLTYPIDQSEIIRNETLDISLNYNRNPFIDDTSLACRIWGNTNDNTRSICSQSTTLESLSMSPTSATLSVGGTQTLSVSATPSGASNSVTWSSSNDSVASVSTSGLVTAKAQGSATITATSTVNTNIKASASITVNAPVAPTSLSMNLSSTSLSVGETANLSVTASPSGAVNTVTWATTNSGVALVNQGTVTAVGVGTATITATSTANTLIKTTCNVTVTAAAPLTQISDYSKITEGNYLITVNKDGAKYYLPKSASGFASGSSSIVAFSNIEDVDTSNAWNFANAGTNLWKISADGYYLNSTTNNDGIGAHNTATDEQWTASSGSSAILLRSSKGSRYLTAAVSLSTKEWRGYGTADTNGTSNIILYKVVTSSVTPLEEATTWAEGFLSQTSSGCTAKSYAQLSAVWDDVQASYDALSEAAQLVITNTTPNAAGTDLENAVARYIQIVKKYSLSAFINGVDVINTADMQVVVQNDTSLLVIFVLIAIVFSSLILALSIKSKRQ